MIINASIGGGSDLCYRVLASAAVPTVAGRKNDVAIITTDAIGDVQLNCVSAPTTRGDGTALQTGDVYITALTTTGSRFNAQKKNALYVLPGVVYQRSGSSWVVRAAYHYDGAAWTRFARDWYGQLYQNGNEYTAVTGGWQGRGWNHQDLDGWKAQAPYVEKQAGTMYASMSTGGASGVLETANNINLAEYSTLSIRYSATGSDSDPIKLYVGNRNNAYPNAGYSASLLLLSGLGECVANSVGVGTLSLNISSLTGSYDVYIHLCLSHRNTYQTVTVYSILLS